LRHPSRAKGGDIVTIVIERVGDLFDDVGESPFWHAGEQALYWIDGWNGLIRRLNARDGTIDTLRVEGKIGCIAARRNGGLVAAMHEREVILLDPGSDAVVWRASCSSDPRIFLNDGKVDRSGRFYFGGRDGEAQDPVGPIFCLEPDLSVRVLAPQEVISANGPCWSPDDSIFYIADSRRHVIYKYDCDIRTGTLSNRRVFADLQEFGGVPDGATVDGQGNIWSAICRAGKIICISPLGKVETVIDMPSPMVSSVTFGGSDMDVLYVTSLGMKTPGYENPRNGWLFAIEGLGARGVEEPSFGG
jgi:sugar lactone lactonase YvrE